MCHADCVELMGSALFGSSRSGTQLSGEADVVSAPNCSCTSKKPPLLFNLFFLISSESFKPSPGDSLSQVLH